MGRKCVIIPERKDFTMRDALTIPPQSTREKLAYAYRICAMLGLDDHTYTHLSARSDCGQGFYLQPFGYRFAEIVPEKLLTVSFAGDVLAGVERLYNLTAYQTHGPVYSARPDMGAVFHLHTPNIVAVSCMEEGLLPLSQWALHFYGRVAYHNYDSLVTKVGQSYHIVDDMGDKPVLLMRNHGCLIVAKTVQEALFYAYHLEQACKTQCLAMATGAPLVMPDAAVAERAVTDLLTFEEDLGQRDWAAWVRALNRDK
jgi:ribulose-5-phosphate 4-epimerase/fuculose-1-phosphate aldolase